MLYPQVSFGDYKQSVIRRELGAYGLENYNAVKSVQVNLHLSLS
ncbi:hypothetical protein VTO73DRAFT_7988 [Trametes versicolor]